MSEEQYTNPNTESTAAAPETVAPAAPAESAAPSAPAEPSAAPSAPSVSAEPSAPAAPSAPSAPAAQGPEHRGPHRGAPSGHRRPYGEGHDGGSRGPKFKKKACRFCVNKETPLDYKRSDILEKFITERGKILPRRVTGTCSRHQRALAREIKRARIVALLPFIEQ